MGSELKKGNASTEVRTFLGTKRTLEARAYQTTRRSRPTNVFVREVGRKGRVMRSTTETSRRDPQEAADRAITKPARVVRALKGRGK